jgi:hypothetical protein
MASHQVGSEFFITDITKSLDILCPLFITIIIVIFITKQGEVARSDPAMSWSCTEGIFMSNILKGKVVLITGGSRGLGAATAAAFAERGTYVAISYAASADKAEAVVAKLKATGTRAIAIKSDQADLSCAKPLIDSVIAEFGKLDILVNNAGVAIQGQLVDAE